METENCHGFISWELQTKGRSPCCSPGGGGGGGGGGGVVVTND